MTEVCREHEEHRDRIAKGKKQVPDRETILEISDFFAALGNPTRLGILYALSGGELCTCDLSNITELSVSAVSHQLRILRDRKLISFRKEGKNVFYRLRDAHVVNVLSVALEHMEEGAGNV
ncbi:MAG: helix-turn-helix transcriptional regulator [Acidobacteria bacterium]|nr:helix-turn-helix transcriptional regulator [Acidobacteriota bacterium]